MKADYLVGNSEVFKILVRAACTQETVPYSSDVIAHVATMPAVLDMLEAREDTTLDQVLRGMAGDADRAHDLDSTILDAVRTFGKGTDHGA